jgi:hypothetical protein
MARSHGLLDPFPLLAKFNRFAHPSEVAAPIELMRSSMVLHARGLMNARTLLTKFDWIWPYWVRRLIGSVDYRILMDRERILSIVEAERPHVIEVDNAYLSARIAVHAGERFRVPVVGFYHSDFTGN